MSATEIKQRIYAFVCSILVLLFSSGYLSTRMVIL